MKQFRCLLAFWVAGLVMAGGFSSEAQADGLRYKPSKKSRLKVDVYHKFKHVIAKSKRVKGQVFFAAKGKGTYALKGALSVRIKSLRSGNRSRDRKMWSSLRKSRQPYIYFFPKTLTWDGKAGKVKGDFKINKIKKEIEFDVTKVEGSIDGKSTFAVKVKGHLKCSDFKVKRPSLLTIKIKNKVDVTMSLVLQPKK